MNQQPKLWQLLLAFLPIFTSIFIWGYNIGTIQKQQEYRLGAVEKKQSDYEINYRQDIKEINDKLNAILIKLENKADRK